MPASFEFEGFQLDTVRRRLHNPEGVAVELPTRAFDVLLFLIEHREELVTKDRLMKAIWPATVVEENNLSQAISTLRRFLGDGSADPRFVLTVPGRGYRFIAAVRPTQDPAQPSPRPAEPASSPARLDSLAVLPFKPLVAGQHDPALCLGMADTLIAAISALPGLRVSPLGTVRRYASLEQDPLAAGAELGVAAVLEGTLQTHGGRLRLTARLLRVADGQSLWSGKFEVAANDIFEIQDSIATQVIEALRPALSERMSLHAARCQTQNLSAYKHYIAGLFNQLRRDIDGLPDAIRNYEAATRADPGYVRAWAGLSVTLAVQAVFGTRPPASVFPRAKEAALHAIELDPRSAEGLGALGHVLVQYECKYEEGRQYYLRARELRPDSAQLQLWIAINEAHLGRTDQAIEEVHGAIELEPRTLAFHAVLGMLMYFQRSYDEAIAHLQHLVGIEPRFDQARTFLGKAWLQKGEPERALEQFLARASTAPGSFGDLGCAYALAGRTEDARREIARLRKLGDEGFGVSYDLAAVHLALHEVQEACECLEAAVADHSQLIGFLRVDPMLDGLRNTSAYASVFRRIYRSA